MTDACNMSKKVMQDQTSGRWVTVSAQEQVAAQKDEVPSQAQPTPPTVVNSVRPTWDDLSRVQKTKFVAWSIVVVVVVLAVVCSPALFSCYESYKMRAAYPQCDAFFGSYNYHYNSWANSYHRLCVRQTVRMQKLKAMNERVDVLLIASKQCVKRQAAGETSSPSLMAYCLMIQHERPLEHDPEVHTLLRHWFNEQHQSDMRALQEYTLRPSDMEDGESVVAELEALERSYTQFVMLQNSIVQKYRHPLGDDGNGGVAGAKTTSAASDAPAAEPTMQPPIPFYHFNAPPRAMPCGIPPERVQIYRESATGRTGADDTVVVRVNVGDLSQILCKDDSDEPAHPACKSDNNVGAPPTDEAESDHAQRVRDYEVMIQKSNKEFSEKMRERDGEFRQWMFDTLLYIATFVVIFSTLLTGLMYCAVKLVRCVWSMLPRVRFA